MVGLANVDNTADSAKPVSTAAQSALDLKENASNKSDAALGTSTTLYPTQNAVKTYVDAQVASATIVDADATTKGKLQLTGDLGGTASSPTVPGLALKAPIESPTFTGTVGGITKTMVGLGNVDNTTDANKPVSTAQLAALDLKAPLASPTFTGTLTAPIYATTPQLLTSGATITWNPTQGLNASVTLDQNSTLSFSATPPSGSYGTLVVTQDGTGGRTLTLPTTTNKVLGSTSSTSIALSTAAGAKDIINFYYDGTNCYWNVGQGYGTASSTDLASSVSGTLAVANGGTGATTLTGYVKGSGTSAMTASASIPVADVTGAAPLASPTFTGTVGGITKEMVGLENVDNTTDANKPVSTAQLAALDLKAPLASPTFTGTPSLPSGTTAVTQLSTDNSTKLATTAFVTSSLSAGAPDATTSATGKVQLAGDLAGTNSSATAPVISDNAITTVKINDAAVTSAKLAADAVTSAKILDGEIVNADISTTAAIADTKLVTIATSGKVSNSATTATDANTASAIVARDGSGNFTAGTITANLTGNVTGNLTGNVSGNASTATSATSFSGNLAGDVTGTQSATVVGKINGTSLAGLSTGLLKNTTTTGVPSIATAGTDYAEGTSALATGILKSTTTTGALTIADAADFPTLNQSTTGNAATATKLAATKTINGVAFDGSSDITVTAAAGTLTGTSLNSTVVSSSLTSVGTLTDLTVTNAIAGSITGNAANVTGTVAVANGGTGLTSTPADGQIDIGNGSGFTRATLTAGTAITITNTAGAITIAAAVRPMTEQTTADVTHAVATATFTLANTPLNAKVWMFINGVRTNNNAYSVSGTTVTYTAANNNSYTIVVGDRVQFDYAY
jgi:hypothetical protein